jgi:uncharacterized protein
VKFEWDEKKAISNISKHDIDFNLAITAFDDPFALIDRDEKHSTSEEIRESLIGESDNGVLVIIFTIRMNRSIYRIISARKDSRRERKLYEEAKRIPL